MDNYDLKKIILPWIKTFFYVLVSPVTYLFIDHENKPDKNGKQKK